MKKTLNVKNIIKKAASASVHNVILNRKTIKDFADRFGLVYFGRVDYIDDQHKRIRGHTSSITHRDTNYLIGNLYGYDVTFVTRIDKKYSKKTQSKQKTQSLIFSIELKTTQSLPRLYIGHKNREDTLLHVNRSMQPLYMGNQWPYQNDFLDEYTVYGAPMDTIQIERIIIPQLTEIMMKHFQQASFEIENNIIYMYIESKRPTGALLDKMLSNVLWLAQSIDAICAARDDD